MCNQKHKTQKKKKNQKNEAKIHFVNLIKGFTPLSQGT
jgi:hypothetical protein